MSESEIVDRYLYAAAILKRIIPELDVRCRSGTAHPGGEPLLKPCFVLYHPNDKKTNVMLDNVAEFEAFAMGVEFLSKMNRPAAAPLDAMPAGAGVDFLKNLQHVLCNVAQVFDGWHCDTAWSDHDRSIRADVAQILRTIDELRKPSARQASCKILVNGKEEIVDEEILTYYDVYRLAGGRGGELLSVTWRSKDGKSGSVHPADTCEHNFIPVSDGLVISVFNTGNA